MSSMRSVGKGYGFHEINSEGNGLYEFSGKEYMTC